MNSNKQMWLNLPVKNLNKSIDFFTKLGFKFDPQLTDQNSTCMIVGEDSFVMLLAEEFFKTFTKKEIADATKSTEIIVAIQVDSREKVNEMVNKAFSVGGKPSNEPYDHGWMYGWSFQDLEGHLWEVFYMNPDKINQDKK